MAPLPGRVPGSRNPAGVEAVAKPFEVIQVASRTIACDGGDGPLGHPRVYLNMGEKDEIVCPYCSRQYVLVHKPVTDAA